MAGKRNNKTENSLITEIKENFDYAKKAWREIRDEARKDMKYLSGDPWEPLERLARTDAKRPCISLDELGQYVNQAINNIRQNSRAIKVNPKSEGASEDIATLRADIIRGIEYKSNAQAAYVTGFENAVQRSYGFWRVSAQYESAKGMNQELVIRRIPNPDTVVLDPDYKEADASDMSFCYVLDYPTKRRFKTMFPNAKVRDFGQEEQDAAPDWIKDDHVQIAEYWKVSEDNRTLLVMDDEGTQAYLDEFADAELRDSAVYSKNKKISGFKDSREVSSRSVCQYVTNGLEVLEKREWAGQWIPIVPVFGKEMFVNDGSGSKRILMSLIRLARDPYKLYCYLCSQEMEEAGMSPRAPYLGAVGQFASDPNWETANQSPVPYLQYEVKTESSGDQPLAPPQRNPFQPNFAAYEMAKESAKRAIQSAVGMFNSSVGKHDTNVKSGKAIQALDQQSAEGNFHFTDNYNRAIEHTGRILDDLLPHYYDVPRDVQVRRPDDSNALVRLNDPSYKDPKTGEVQHNKIEGGEYEVTISTGPSYQSQREEAAAFADTLAATPLFPQVADLIVKMKNLGPLGDKMAERLTPPQFADDGSPEKIAAQAQQATQQVQQLHAYAQQLEQKLQQLMQEKQGKVVEMQSRMQIEQLHAETQITVASITAKMEEAKALIGVEMKRLDLDKQLHSELHDSAHDLAMQTQQQSHEKQMTAESQAHDQNMAEQGHVQTLEQQDAAAKQQKETVKK